MKISFIVVDRYHIGGVVTATHNLAGALAEKHEVEIVSLRRTGDTSPSALDSRVRTVDLTDGRPGSPHYDGEDPLMGKAPLTYPDTPVRGKPWVSRLAEKRLLSYLETTDADVVVSSNPKISLLLGRATGGSYLKIAQEHSRPTEYRADIRKPLFELYKTAFDAVTVLTPEEYRTLGEACEGRAPLSVLPNCIPAAGPARSTGRNKAVVTAGVLKAHKGFDDLVDAFAIVATRRPDWELRIYGDGEEKRNLRTKIESLKAYNNVFLMGPVDGVADEFAKGSIFVLPSKREPFGVVLVEAMAARLPVISTDCDHGPRNIVSPGVDGTLVPVGDPLAMAQAMLQLIEDDEKRLAMGLAAEQNAARFQEPASLANFEHVLGNALARRSLPDRATCRVSWQGDLHVRLLGRARDHALHLLCRPVGGPHEPLRFPFRPAPDWNHEIAPEAVVPGHGSLPDGEWELLVQSDEGHAVPLRAESVDAGELLNLTLPRAEGVGLQYRVPYLAEGRRLRVRSVVREVHAEVAGLAVLPESVQLNAVLWGGQLAQGAAVVAHHRQSGRRL
ncbi:glycosyltransferase, partial [Streptomyces sp. T-3]|nr:glycosyltransferase [Streptomyces sp. T-3]